MSTIKKTKEKESYVTRVMDTDKWYWCKCENCGWEDSSEFAEGGHAIGESGDYTDPSCPLCGSANLDGDSQIDVPSYEGLQTIKIPLEHFLSPYNALIKKAWALEDKLYQLKSDLGNGNVNWMEWRATNRYL